MWLDSLRFQNKPVPPQTSKAVVMNSEIEKDFDRFNDETRGKYYIEENELLKYWMEQTRIDKNLVKEMFGKKYFALDSDEVDSLYVWIRDQRDNGGITEIK